ncbi:MAG TPA: hypothetical protein VHP14_04250 [Anaerolineales bacterium]|nr:hypothetical protein [Anaerolineales bacterium]
MMKNTILFLRIAYWWGVLADVVSAVLMLFPNLFLRVMNFNITPGRDFAFGLSYGAPLMIGWTILLFWADRKPVERKDILLLTLPIIIGYIVIEIFAISTGTISVGSALPLLAMQIGLFLFIIFSCRQVRSRAVEMQRE